MALSFLCCCYDTCLWFIPRSPLGASCSSWDGSRYIDVDVSHAVQPASCIQMYALAWRPKIWLPHCRQHSHHRLTSLCCLPTLLLALQHQFIICMISVDTVKTMWLDERTSSLVVRAFKEHPAGPNSNPCGSKFTRLVLKKSLHWHS